MTALSETNAGKLVRNLIGAALSPIRAGESSITSRKPDTQAPLSIEVTSAAFTNGGAIPEKFSALGQNVSPPLAFSGVPQSARELILVCEDPDAPKLRPFVHWILHRLPAHIQQLPEGVLKEREVKDLSGAVQGQNDAGARGYFGPKPPMGHGVHHYHFQLFAVDTQLSLGPDATLDELTRAMSGHIIAEGELVGTYEVKAT